MDCALRGHPPVDAGFLIGFWEWRSALLCLFTDACHARLTLGRCIFGYGHPAGLAARCYHCSRTHWQMILFWPATHLKNFASEGSRHYRCFVASYKLAGNYVVADGLNIVAYLPFPDGHWKRGRLLRSLPLVMTCAHRCWRLVSMTFCRPCLLPACGLKRSQRSLWKRCAKRDSDGGYAKMCPLLHPPQMEVFSSAHWLFCVIGFCPSSAD